MHGDDERVNIDELILSAQIFAQVIVDVCGE
jgi:acetylornithine deacetylase/succinyl-diaminopimelate desuccinylase-like protein